MFAEAGGVQGLPLTARTQNKEDRIPSHLGPIPGIMAAQRMGLAGRNKGQHPLPEQVGNGPTIVFDYYAHVQELLQLSPPFKGLPG